ncbi:MAG: F0F1 ATP synthase subunit epsilon [Patescibacteria group bacterium]
MKIKFKIITPEREIFSEEAEQITMMTRDGEITILPGHIPLITVLQPGELRYKKDGEEKFLAVSGGFAEMRPDNTLVILADTAEYAEHIDIERAEAARERAAKAMKETRNVEGIDYAALQAQLERAVNRVKIAKKYRKLPPMANR